MTHGRRKILPETPLDARVARAWERLRPGRAEATRIEIVKKSRNEHRAIYRLTGTGLRDAAIIAKKCPAESAWIEHTAYEQILPCLPVTAPRFHGFVEDDGCGWLFIEDVGQERFSPDNEDHRVLAGRWLGTMHTAAARVAAAARLPDRGPNHHLARLRSARRAILEHPADHRFGPDHVAILERVVRLCDALESEWALLAKCCEGVPATLVHGDFRRKNLYVRATDSGGAALLPIDWETAGWGVPAADLAPSRRRHEDRHIDLVAYRAVVGEHWPAMEMPALERLVRVGLVFRRLDAIYWAGTNLVSEGTEAVAVLDGYRAELSEVMESPPWRH